jgi:Mg2+ and Co2+ transporter CorA
MDTPAQPLARSQHIYAFALALMFIALVASAILFMLIDI